MKTSPPTTSPPGLDPVPGSTPVPADTGPTSVSVPAEAEPAPAPAGAGRAAGRRTLPRPYPGPRVRELLRASGGGRYAVAQGVDALGNGMLRPFLLLYGIDVLRLSAPLAGTAMTLGVLGGLCATPTVGRRLDRGPRSAVVAASMLVRVLGTLLLLAAPAGGIGQFTAAALFLGIGNQAMPVAHAALVATVSTGRERDAALAAARSVRNAGMGLGALVTTGCLAGGAPALRALAAASGAGFLLAAALAASVRVSADPAPAGPNRRRSGSVPRVRALLSANVVYVFCLNVPEIALPLVVVSTLHASPMWAAGIFVANTVLVVALQVPVTVWMARLSRNTAMAMAVAGLVISASYMGFLAASALGHGIGAPAVAAVSVLCTLGEIIYAGSAGPLLLELTPQSMIGRALARFQLSTGLGLALSPVIITALAAHGAAALWLTLTAVTLPAAYVVGRQAGSQGD
ncbi:MFS transporter [Actinacidiphila acididurans]|uniref:MFS transporter n=1 Tax=Actinacidiphila acididurans TaxID=2784346 RepID=A0ABS2U298_9ACTN|nr:MFS transporter [Actinacidiphila acididurans]MBM9509472.1 MFS transporter [Actinacidiphila acididurans]